MKTPKKSHPYWHCPRRKMVCQPLVFSRIDSGLPVAGHIILCRCRWGVGKIIISPDVSFEQSQAFWKAKEVEWWAYLPSLPLNDYGKRRILNCDSFIHHATWTSDATTTESKLEIALLTLQQIKDAAKHSTLAKRLASSTLAFIASFK